MYNSGTVYTADNLRYDFDHGADVLFDYKGVSYGLFFFIKSDDEEITGCDIYIGPSGKHKTEKFKSVDDLLNRYYMLDGATMAQALSLIEVAFHS
ncbi:hypothetical protein FACS1894184_18280 [Clostridia bacterium]|nr:hypothetical protein FACS1894184_18280 [Clostridia bacterium]